jgi:hypothetical protein
MDCHTNRCSNTSTPSSHVPYKPGESIYGKWIYYVKCDWPTKFATTPLQYAYNGKNANKKKSCMLIKIMARFSYSSKRPSKLSWKSFCWLSQSCFTRFCTRSEISHVPFFMNEHNFYLGKQSWVSHPSCRVLCVVELALSEQQYHFNCTHLQCIGMLMLTTDNLLPPKSKGYMKGPWHKYKKTSWKGLSSEIEKTTQLLISWR